MRPRNRLHNSNLGLWDLRSLSGGKKVENVSFSIFILYLRYSHILNKGVMIFRNKDKESKCMSSSLHHSFYKHRNSAFLYISSLSFVSKTTILEWILILKKKSISCHLFTEKPNSSIFRVLTKLRLFFTPDWSSRFQELLWIRGQEEAIISSENDLKISVIFDERNSYLSGANISFLYFFERQY